MHEENYDPLITLDNVIKCAKLLFRSPPDPTAVTRYEQLLLLLKQQISQLEKDQILSNTEKRDNLISKIAAIQERLKDQNVQLDKIIKRLNYLRNTLSFL
jgi:hypothetical protein